jgi:hypothetical protein
MSYFPFFTHNMTFSMISLVHILKWSFPWIKAFLANVFLFNFSWYYWILMANLRKLRRSNVIFNIIFLLISYLNFFHEIVLIANIIQAISNCKFIFILNLEFLFLVFNKAIVKLFLFIIVFIMSTYRSDLFNLLRLYFFG